MVRSDGIDDLGFFLILFGQFHTDHCMWQFGFVIGYLADIVQQACPLGGVNIGAQLGGLDTGGGPGNACPNGAAYGKEELTHPTRIITSTVRAEGCLHSRCPVKTSKPVPKGQMAEVVAALDSVVLHAPIHVGDVVLTDVCGTGADIVTCRDMA